MTEIWAQGAFWLLLAIAAAFAAAKFRINLALAEVVTGVLANFVLITMLGMSGLPTDTPWVKFLAGAGAIMLTFLAGAELDPQIVRQKWREAVSIGLASFALPALIGASAAHYVLGWAWSPGLLAGIALSATSVAVVYTVMLETGLNRTTYGKILLAACFITDLVTVVALGLFFSPFTFKSIVFIVLTAGALTLLAKHAPDLLTRFGNRTSELEIRALLACLLSLGALALWSGNEAVLPAYLVGMALAGSVGNDYALIKRLRAITLGLLTPFYFIRAGSLVSLPTVLYGLGGFLVLLIGHLGAKSAGVYPVARFFGSPRPESLFTTLLMATGLTFGTIAALFGLSHNIITPEQYSLLVATIIATAVVPTLIACKYFLPAHHLSPASSDQEPV